MTPDAAEQPQRVRVSLDSRTAAADSTRTQGIALPGAPVHEAGAVFLNDLMRAQLRLAGACLIGFLLVSLAFTAVIMIMASTADPPVFGVPASWIMQAYGYYPIILLFAVVFARNAARNERRYRGLAEDDERQGRPR
ncbi:putative solute:sodium symporter small subunit [Microbacterium sp. W4I4]|uniref:heavy metal transporter n=1 Tax=Microbacterium sp. W4I4 TaxID=3042295 RepID=UPI0027849CB5|nr:heavy metal transporter [Microbacterium sp. W4I4]MDQ0613822.1 putative solute:sodium symporter small subunit [Microbacterium sp. W4I4]